MKTWHHLIANILINGAQRPDRTGVGTVSLFGQTLTVDNSDLLPFVTSKKLFVKQVLAELACFVHGFDNLEDFHSMGCSIWDANGEAPYWTSKANYPGHLGRIYGVQWRDYRGDDGESYDQLRDLVNGLRLDPYGRRHLVTAWNPAELDKMCLPPCHVMFQCYLDLNGKLDMAVTMRSVDVFLGLPFDIASYAILQRLIAKAVGGNVHSGKLVFFLGDTHIYSNHLEQCQQVLQNEVHDGPRMVLAPDATLWNFKPSDVSFSAYNEGPVIKAPMAV